MLTMGGDFQYQNARINYKNIEKLIEYVNSAAVCHISMHCSLYQTLCHYIQLYYICDVQNLLSFSCCVAYFFSEVAHCWAVSNQIKSLTLLYLS